MPKFLEREEVGKQHRRSFKLDARQFDPETRTVQLAFASEAPVERLYGIEILSCAPQDVDLTRLLDGGPFLMDHDPGEQVGVVMSASIDQDKVARATVKLSRSEDGEELALDIADGIRTKVSVGYQVTRLLDKRERPDGQTEYVWAWMPYEISSVAIPADNSVGIGRAAANVDAVAAIPQATEATAETVVIEVVTQEKRNMADELNTERERAKEILALGEHHKMQGDAAKAVAEGMPVEQFRANVLGTLEKRLADAQKPQMVGMDTAEVKRYSMVKAIRELADNGRLTGLEKEAHEAVAKSGKKTRGGLSFLVPADVTFDNSYARGNILTTPAAQGGYAIQTNVLGGSFVDILRNKMVLSKLGATMLTGLQGDISIPAKLAAGSVAWIAEGSATTLSGLTFRQIPMVPKTIRCAQAFSRKMMMQASLDVEALVRNDLTMSIGVELDRVGLNGSGAGAEPRGLLNMASIGSVTTTGAGLTWAAVCELESDVAIANADIGSLAFCTNAKVRGKAKQTLKISTATNGVTLWEALTAMYPAEVTNNMPSTLGVGSNASACVFGNWNDLLIGLWSGQEVLVDPYSRSLYGEIQVVMFQEADVAARHEDSFSAVQDLITT